MLRFRLFGFPVSIQPGFWVLAVLLGLSFAQKPVAMMVWLGVVLVSILVHELGHASTARLYGQSPAITLHMMGGLTSWTPTHDIGRRRGILVTLAGPFAGFALGLAALGIKLGAGTAVPHGSMLALALELLIWANVLWSAINLLPVLPFDGGQILAQALGPRRRRLAASLSLVFGLALAAGFYKLGWTYAALIFALGGVSSFMSERNRSRYQGPPPPELLSQVMVRAEEAMNAGDHASAAGMAKAVFDASGDPEQRRLALELSGWATVMGGDAAAARDVLRHVPPGGRIDPYLEGAIHELDGDLDRARAVLLSARHSGDLRPELAGLLVRVLLRTGRPEDAAGLTSEILEDTPDEDTRRVAAEAFEAGAAEAAGRLLHTLFERTQAPRDAYDAARGYARAKLRDEALGALEEAVRAGHSEPARARTDADLSTLSDDARFELALAGGAQSSQV